jgi:hypothetical protein
MITVPGENIPPAAEASRIAHAFTRHYLESQKNKGTLPGAIEALKKVATAKF